MENRLDHKPLRPQRPVHAWLDFGVSGLGPIFVALLAFVISKNLNSIARILNIDARPAAKIYQESPQATNLKQLSSAVVYDTEGTWSLLFSEAGRIYRRPALGWYSEAPNSACRTNAAWVGSFYCVDELKVYIDVPFANQLHQRLGARSDFAQAYVIAHAVGHHVQNVLGVVDHALLTPSNLKKRAQKSAFELRLELQADCYAGVWMRRSAESRPILADGDIETGLRTVSAVSRERLATDTRGHGVSEAFQHGSAERRERWFKTGFDSGRIEDCDTFAARKL